MPRFILILLLLLTLNVENVFSQGKNHNWLIGYDQGLFDTYVVSDRAFLRFDSINVTVTPDSFPMPFSGAEANISDENGNLLMATNGCWIADATGAQMQNGGGLNPSSYTTNTCRNYQGIPYMCADVIVPFPGDSLKYALFHQTNNTTINGSTELYWTGIDMSLHNGLGGVYTKNNIVINDTVNMGIAACKHANGRDWWITCFKDRTDSVYTLLLTPSGITSISIQALNVPTHPLYAGTPVFSPDGSKFAYFYWAGGGTIVTNQIRLFDFDRCTGTFSNGLNMLFTDSMHGYGLSFSPNSKLLYYSTYQKIYQLSLDSPNIAASSQLVATYDGHCYPYSFTCTDFWTTYLAANGKIYITSGGSTVELNYISAPDSIGIACNVMQHAVRLPCYTSFEHVNHPNYYLGPLIGSACDTLAHVGLQEHMEEVQNFQIAPNPISAGALKITYLLPQNAAGVFEVFDLNGKLLYSENLAPWSSLQYVNLPALRNGVYICEVRSGASRMTRKLVVIK